MGFFTFLPKFVHAHPNALFPPGVVALFAPAGSLTAAAVLAKWRGPSGLVLATMGFSGIAGSALFIISTQAYGGVAMAIYAFLRRNLRVFSIRLCSSVDKNANISDANN